MTRLERIRKQNPLTIAVVGSFIIALMLIGGTIWTGVSARKDNQEAVRQVSLLYLDELAGRREQVVEDNLKGRIHDLESAISLMEPEDTSDKEHLQAYQARMKKLYTLEKFAFVDDEGTILTSLGWLTNISDYSFDYKNLSETEISILNTNTEDKKVVIATPVDKTLGDKYLRVCFMEIDMEELLAGVSIASDQDQATFCNLYTTDGIALTNYVLGGLAGEDNLLDAMKKAQFEEGYSYDKFIKEFSGSEDSEVSFRYNEIKETLSFSPVKGTDWVLTYLVRESVIADNINDISEDIVSRIIVWAVFTFFAMLMMLTFIYVSSKKTNQERIEREAAEAETRGKEAELKERIKLQEKLEEQSVALADALGAAEDANNAKTAFLSNMSHEIRTPMNAIIGLNSIALNDPETPEKTKEYLEKIGGSADHLLALINDILDMSRIESGRMVVKNEEFSFFKLLETINTMISGQCQDKGLEYHCKADSNLDPYYIGDPMKIRQVLINILGNAVKFTPEGGAVSLDIRRTAQFDGKSTLRFVIADSGIGISEEFIPKIFETFAQEDSSATNRYGSSGLGLAITKNMVEMMNGDISVESEKAVGTTFTVNLTLDESSRKDEGAEGDDIPVNEMKVLIIDDDEVACEHAKLVLEKAGIAAEIAMSGKEAISMVELHHARQNPYNLILVDWKMPGMDGVETTKEIRKIVGNESAIIILTAYKWDDVLEEALSAGVDTFLPKPIFAQTVIEEFNSAMKSKNVIGKQEAAKADLKGRRVILAEDVEINAEIMTMVLANREVTADLAKTGKEAVELFENHAEGYYDAILMDMRMPEMDGLEATRVIRAMDRTDAGTIPIIALTANAFDEDVQRSLQAGLNAHLSKPVQPDDLFATLEILIKD